MKEKVLIIPGNPSAETIYKNWITILQNDFPSYEFKLLPLPKIENHFTNLDIVISHYHKKIQEEVSPPIIIGHSIGGYFASQIFKKDSKEIKKMILIFPYFGDENFAGRALLNLAEMVVKKPKRINFLTKIKPIVDKYYQASSQVTVQELEDSIKLAKLEKDHFKKENSAELSFLQDKRVDFLYTSKDNWCTPKTVQRVAEFNSPHFVDTIHDFVVSFDEINKVHKFLKDKNILK
ncbi:alpha/beta hydrolase [Bacteriovorax sp. Seq25_V]|uniref:alpha/beta hydrolase n=1 Tax=Bacteriovorax sp. Seq25_V TaxID=1201288 RepID=UPI000389FA25|nr:alpha/beta hydrolase [Bacteriovorax sp. Seq25_V]EQC47700.1 alpha/beta hydrolase family protein [Bacteriovorax sp. Seq25_V]